MALPASYSDIHVGLPIRSRISKRSISMCRAATSATRRKRVGSVTLLLEKSSSVFEVGPDSGHLTRYALKPFETVSNTFTGPREINLTSAFNDNGRIFIRHDQPLPLTILGIIPNVEAGG
jgi:hypothetical protein